MFEWLFYASALAVGVCAGQCGARLCTQLRGGVWYLRNPFRAPKV